MTDLWSFLLQTLTASGAAAFLLVVKYLFRDKLSPRWQFGIWGLLALVLLHPAGQGGTSSSTGPCGWRPSRPPSPGTTPSSV